MNHKHTTTMALFGARFLLAAGTSATAQGDCCAAQRDQRSASYYDTTGNAENVSGIGVPPGGDDDQRVVDRDLHLRAHVHAQHRAGTGDRHPADTTADAAGEHLLPRQQHPFGQGRRADAVAELPLRYARGQVAAVCRRRHQLHQVHRREVAPGLERADGRQLGLAAQAGIAYAIDRNWGLYGSVGYADVKSNIVATGATVLTATADFKPFVYSAGPVLRVLIDSRPGQRAGDDGRDAGAVPCGLGQLPAWERR